MSEQVQDLQGQIAEQQALNEFERWVNESNQIDAAYASGNLAQWMEKKLQREQFRFQKLSGNGNE